MAGLLRWLDPLLNPEACLPAVPAADPIETPDILLKRLDLLLRRRLQGTFPGSRPSIMRGQGLDFRNLRRYAPGDDIRKMDWKVLARTLVPHIREYQEEKQWTVWLTVDLTPSMQFGRRESKARRALELAGLLGLLACREGHRLGALILSGGAIEDEIVPPGQGEGHLRLIMHSLTRKAAITTPRLVPENALAQACGKLAHIVRKDSTILVLSDFIGVQPDWSRDLGRLSRYTRLIYLMIRDAAEGELPAGLGLLPVTDLETGCVQLADTNDPGWIRAYREAAEIWRREALTVLEQSGKAVFLPMEETPVESLLTLMNALKGGG